MVLSGTQIAERLRPNQPRDRRLYVLPLRTLRVELASASVDVHLGQEFMAPRKASVGYLDPLEREARGQAFRAMGAVGPSAWEGAVLERVCAPMDGEFMLHPGQFALASVYEYVKLPLDLCADVVGRSSWARVGLIVAMATFVHPGYAGCLTLELQNLGEVPIRLKPGLRVAQIIFREVHPVPRQPYDQLACSYGPEYRPVVSADDSDLLRLLEDPGGTSGPGAIGPEPPPSDCE